MKLDEALQELNSKFVYKHDFVLYDSWKVMDVTKEKWYGDCEDYSLTLLFLLADKDKKRFWKVGIASPNIQFYACWSKLRGHFVIKVQGNYVDNISRRKVTKKHLKNNGYRGFVRIPKWLIKLRLLRWYYFGK